MKTVKTSKNGVDYLNTKIAESPLTVVRAMLYEIKHNNPENNEVCIKLSKFAKKKKGEFNWAFEELESTSPKSELTLKGKEFEQLIEFISQEYKPFAEGYKKFIPIDNQLESENIGLIKTFFEHPSTEELVGIIVKDKIIPDHLLKSINHVNKVLAIEEFESMLSEDLVEHDWQKWFLENSWVLGTEYVKILDERNIDTDNISDFLLQAHDGFLDIVEIKRPDGNLSFWATGMDHNNYIPHQDLIKAITQVSVYIYEVERESNSVKFVEKVGGVKTVKPRCVLIYGRSEGWNQQQNEAFRILNSNYHNISIVTYDQVLARAKKLIE